MNDTPRTYLTKEVAKRLQVEPVTIRKYTQILEDKGYLYKKDDRGWRMFSEEDIKGLEYLCLLKLNGQSLEDAAEHIASLYSSNLAISQPYMALQDRDPVLDFMKRQEDFNRELLKRLDRQEQYIENNLKKRDEQLLTSIREIQETKLLVAANQRGKWWQFWK